MFAPNLRQEQKSTAERKWTIWTSLLLSLPVRCNKLVVTNIKIGFNFQFWLSLLPVSVCVCWCGIDARTRKGCGDSVLATPQVAYACYGNIDICNHITKGTWAGFELGGPKAIKVQPRCNGYWHGTGKLTLMNKYSKIGPKSNTSKKQLPQSQPPEPTQKKTAIRQEIKNSNWQNAPSEADKQPAFQSFGPHFSCQKASHQTGTFGAGYLSSGIEEWHATLQPVGVLMWLNRTKYLHATT